MQRKDYEKFAQMINEQKQALADLQKAILLDKNSVIASERMIQSFESSIADIFQDDNPRFDRERFLQACGIKS